jgi:hypothetical protein
MHRRLAALALAAHILGCAAPTETSADDAGPTGARLDARAAAGGEGGASSPTGGETAFGGEPVGPPPPDAEPPTPPCSEGDADQDGYGTGAGCAGPDCDDANPVVHPDAVEACNNLDEDCDGVVDEALGERACGQGACRTVAATCVDGRPAACVPGAPGAELCNGVDDDCDGATDEAGGVTRCGVGACERTAACVDGVEGACAPGDAAPEVCNGLDEDCDGRVDQGFGVRVEGARYSILIGQHDRCDGSSERGGPHCNAAINRQCRNQGCAVSGFGPLENSGDDAAIACVLAGEQRQVSYADLAARHVPCDGVGQRIGSDCNAAIHRWCVGQGFASGFGPVEQGPDEATVVCVPGGTAEVVQTDYGTLAQALDVCDGTQQRIGVACNAAIHRHCARTGFVTGFGPVENSGATAVITCLRP